jgi:hypothetical protein
MAMITLERMIFSLPVRDLLNRKAGNRKAAAPHQRRVISANRPGTMAS